MCQNMNANANEQAELATLALFVPVNNGLFAPFDVPALNTAEHCQIAHYAGHNNPGTPDFIVNHVAVPQAQQVRFEDFGQHANNGNVEIAFDPFQVPNQNELQIVNWLNNGLSLNHFWGKGENHYYLGIAHTNNENAANQLVQALNQVNYNHNMMCAVVWQGINNARYIVRNQQQQWILAGIADVPNGYMRWLQNPDPNLGDVFQ